MIGFLIGALQILGPIFGVLNFIHNVFPPIKAAMSGAVEATAGGFWAPLSLNVLATVLMVITPWVAPKWQSILEWIRSILPKPEPEKIIQELIDAIKAAYQEKQENGQIAAKNFMAKLSPNTGGELEPQSDKALKKLLSKMDQIKKELGGSEGGVS